jgi:hypothetical protein
MGKKDLDHVNPKHGTHADQDLVGVWEVRLFSWRCDEGRTDPVEELIEVVDSDEDDPKIAPRWLLPFTEAGIDAALAKVKAELMEWLDEDFRHDMGARPLRTKQRRGGKEP